VERDSPVLRSERQRHGYGSQTFTWNDRNQLQATSAGSSSFAYDGLNRRLSKTVGGTTTKFLYDGPNVVQEQNSSNTATANLLKGLGIDQTFSRQVVGGAASSLVTDALGSTIGLGDASGAVQTSYTYEPFGAMASSGATNTNTYQFTGRENDESTGQYFYRARYYNPTFGRFISEDPLGFPGGPDLNLYVYALYDYRARSYSPTLQRFLTEDAIGFAAGDVNLYAYVGNGPTNFVDPLGLEQRDDGGCGILGLRCAYRFVTQPRVLRDIGGCVFGGIRVFVSIVPLEAAFPPTSVAAVAVGCAGGVGATEALHGGT